jgi:hypothetical protein
MNGRRVSAKTVEQERARALGARRLLPWAVVTAVSGAALGAVAGGGFRAAGALGAVGLVFALFLWVTSIPRCPACGGRLAFPRSGERLQSCPRCRALFE